MSDLPPTPAVQNPADHFDLVIVGAGIHGAGCAQAAAVNGLKSPAS